MAPTVLRLSIIVMVLFIPGSKGVAAPEGEFTLIFSGETNGYLEPCGCNDNPLGGIARRATAIAKIRAKEREVLVIDNGDIVSGYGEQDAIKLDVIIGAMRRMGYDLVNLGEGDIAWGDDVLSGYTNKYGISFIRANAGPQIIYKNVGNIRVLIAAVNAWNGMQSLQGWFAEGRLGEYENLQTALNNSVHDEFKVLLFHGPREVAARLAELVSGFHVVIAGHNREDPAPAIERNGTLFFSYASKGKSIGIVDVEKKRKGLSFQHRMLELDEEIPVSADMKDILRDYDKALRDRQLVLRLSN